MDGMAGGLGKRIPDGKPGAFLENRAKAIGAAWGRGGELKVWQGAWVVPKDSYESFLVFFGFLVFFKGGKIVKQPCPYICLFDAWKK